VSRSRFWAFSTLMLLVCFSATNWAQPPDKAKDDKSEPAGDKVDIKWKFEKDKPFYQEMTTKTTQDMKVMGMDVNQKQDQTFYFSWTLKDEDKDKNMVVVQRIEGVKLTIQIAGNPITFDSTNPTTANNALAEFFKALVGSEFKLTLDKDYKVIKVEGRDDFLKKLTQANQQMEPLLKKILSEEALKQMADPTFGLLPPKAVAKGETWNRESKLSLGPIGGYKSNLKYTYEGQDDKNKDLAKIKIDTTLTYEPPTDAGDGLPFKIKEAKLTSKNAKGEVLFDVKKGRLEKSTQSLELEGELNIEIGGMATKVELKQKQDTTISTSETPHVKKPS
jgi:hypothetical protein